MEKYKKKELIKFCIISTQRSGSTWLRTLLDSHPEIRALDEIFILCEPGRVWSKHFTSFCNFKETHSYKRPWLTFHYLDTLNNYPGEHKAIGFKLMYDQIKNNPEILWKITQDGFKVIHLVRDNYLDILLSRENAWGNAKKNVMHTTEKVELPPVYLNTSSLLKRMELLKAQEKKYKVLLKFLPISVIQINYLNLCNNTETVLESIAKFLKLQNTEIGYKSQLQKINQGEYRKKIANYEEVKNLLTGTQFEHLLMEN